MKNKQHNAITLSSSERFVNREIAVTLVQSLIRMAVPFRYRVVANGNPQIVFTFTCDFKAACQYVEHISSSDNYTTSIDE